MSTIHWGIVFVPFRFRSENNHMDMHISSMFSHAKSFAPKAAPKNPTHCPNTYSELAVFTQCKLFLLNCLSKHLFLSTIIYFEGKPANYESFCF